MVVGVHQSELLSPAHDGLLVRVFQPFEPTRAINDVDHDGFVPSLTGTVPSEYKAADLDLLPIPWLGWQGSVDTSTSTKSVFGDLTGRVLGEEAGFLGLVSDMRKAP